MVQALNEHLGIVTPAAEAIGIARSTHYVWMNDDPEYVAAVKDCKEFAIDIAETALMKNVKEGKEPSIFFYLKCQAKARGYIEKHEVDINMPEGVNISIAKDVE